MRFDPCQCGTCVECRSVRTFSDDDLKRLKEDLARHRDGCTCKDHALIARLEAAEAYIALVADGGPYGTYDCEALDGGKV